MEYKEYEKKLIEELRQMNGGTDVLVNSILRNNGVERKALLILPEGENCAPDIYLTDMYEHYSRNNLTVRESAEYVMLIHRELMKNLNETFLQIKDITDFEGVRDHLTVRMINREMNRILLQETVSIPFYDLAGIFFLAGSLDSMTAGVRVTRQMQNNWGVSLDRMIHKFNGMI